MVSPLLDENRASSPYMPGESKSDATETKEVLMRGNALLVGFGLICGLLLAACGVGGGTREGRQPSTFPEGTVWPQVLEGVVEVAVEEGDVGDDGFSEINFGSVDADTGTYLIAIPGDVLRAAGISGGDDTRPTVPDHSQRPL
jgi:hypothetical protein